MAQAVVRPAKAAAFELAPALTLSLISYYKVGPRARLSSIQLKFKRVWEFYSFGDPNICNALVPLLSTVSLVSPNRGAPIIRNHSRTRRITSDTSWTGQPWQKRYKGCTCEIIRAVWSSSVVLSCLTSYHFLLVAAMGVLLADYSVTYESELTSIWKCGSLLK